MTDEQLRSKYDALEQQWLPFDFVEEEKQKTQEEAQRRQENLPCYEAPRTDNERLLQYQYEYKHGQQEALSKIYELSMEICLKFIRKIGQNNRHVRVLSTEQKKVKAADAASYLVEQYITRPDFQITKNAPGYLFLRVEKELFYMRKVDGIVDFVDLDAFFKEGSEDEDEEEQ